MTTHYPPAVPPPPSEPPPAVPPPPSEPPPAVPPPPSEPPPAVPPPAVTASTPPPQQPAPNLPGNRYWGGQVGRPGLAGTLADTTGSVVTALRLLARHWPALLAIFLLGALAHELALRAAVRTSLITGELGVLVLLLAPMSMLTALVLMLRTLRPSLPYLGGQRGSPPVLEHLGSVLIPFLTIYYFENYLYEDLASYDERVVVDDIGRQFALLGQDDQAGQTTDLGSRLVYDLTAVLVAVVLVAIVARWLLSRPRITQRRRWLGIPGAYLELVWLSLVYLAFMAVAEQILEWGGDRRVVQATVTGWEEAVGALTGLAEPFGAIGGWVTGQLGYLTAVIIVPIAWLAVAAVVLGRAPAPVLPETPGPARELYLQAERRWTAVPRGAQWLAKKLTADLRGRFVPLIRGARMLARAGLAPMLLFCLAFTVVRTTEDWLWQLQRWLIGPQDLLNVWLPLSWPMAQLNQAVSYTLLACLLAAVVDRTVQAGDQAQSAGSRA